VKLTVVCGAIVLSCAFELPGPLYTVTVVVVVPVPVVADADGTAITWTRPASNTTDIPAKGHRRSIYNPL
jgi:hypothetical protein